MRVIVGEWVWIIFENEGGYVYMMYFYGIYLVEVDGVWLVCYGKIIVYEFDVWFFGVYFYYCYIILVICYISKGLYGMFIIDFFEGCFFVDEIVLVMGGYDINNDGKNEFYVFNGLLNYYKIYLILI